MYMNVSVENDYSQKSCDRCKKKKVYYYYYQWRELV